MNPRLFHYCSNKTAEKGIEKGVKYLSFQQNSLKDVSPEKAGVGGSIPSLATILLTISGTLRYLRNNRWVEITPCATCRFC
jgi:hypothetical protein